MKDYFTSKAFLLRDAPWELELENLDYELKGTSDSVSNGVEIDMRMEKENRNISETGSNTINGEIRTDSGGIGTNAGIGTDTGDAGTDDTLILRDVKNVKKKRNVVYNDRLNMKKKKKQEKVDEADGNA